MPKLKSSELNFDEEELEGAEWSEEDDYQTYEGEQPPTGIILHGFIKKMWITETEAGSDMLVVLFEARDNVGDFVQYDGWATWDRIVLQANTKFRWKPFLNATGLSLKDIKTKMYVGEDEERNGLPIQKIAAFVPGEDSDDAWLRILTKRESYNGEWQAKVSKWLVWEDPEDAEAAEEDEEPEEPPAGKASPRGGAKATKARASRAKPAAEEDPLDDEEEEEEEV
ncbi:MAG: hypothetical protein OK454_12050, partial [Thaumarchaeota archaeon]|nr:hypothetical protein [Nitrososphaerota archaeon]